MAKRFKTKNDKTGAYRIIKRDNSEESLYAFIIAIYLLTIFAILMLSVTFVSFRRNDLEWFNNIELVAATFGGWIATVLMYYFHGKQIENVKNTADFDSRKWLRNKANTTTLAELQDNKLDKYKKVNKFNSENKIGEAFYKIYFEKYHHIPIVDNNDKIKGIITKTDLVDLFNKTGITLTKPGLENKSMNEISKLWNSNALKHTELKKLFDSKIDFIDKKYDLIKEPPLVMNLNESINEGIKKIWHSGKKSIPLVDDDNKIQGMLTTWDILAYLKQMFDEPVE